VHYSKRRMGMDGGITMVGWTIIVTSVRGLVSHAKKTRQLNRSDLVATTSPDQFPRISTSYHTSNRCGYIRTLLI